MVKSMVDGVLAILARDVSINLCRVYARMAEECLHNPHVRMFHEDRGVSVAEDMWMNMTTE
jgi:hypothetical protein